MRLRGFCRFDPELRGVLLLTICTAFLGGYLGLRYKVPAGALVGATVGQSQARQMLELWSVVLLAVVSFLLGLVAAAVISRCTDMDPVTALFACTPGGLTDMVLIAADLGADSSKVTAMQRGDKP